jgi:hypothetical protein
MQCNYITLQGAYLRSDTDDAGLVIRDLRAQLLQSLRQIVLLCLGPLQLLLLNRNES